MYRLNVIGYVFSCRLFEKISLQGQVLCGMRICLDDEVPEVIMERIVAAGHPEALNCFANRWYVHAFSFFDFDPSFFKTFYVFLFPDRTYS